MTPRSRALATVVTVEDRTGVDGDVRDLLSSAQPNDDCLRWIETEATGTQSRRHVSNTARKPIDDIRVYTICVEKLHF